MTVISTVDVMVVVWLPESSVAVEVLVLTVAEDVGSMVMTLV